MRRRHAIHRALALLAAAVVGAGACSVVIRGDDAQCRTEGDCSAFPNATCVDSVCVPKGASTTTGTGGSAGCAGPDGCYQCEPKNDSQFLNACTDAKCVKFDTTRLTNLTADGGLPELPTP